jgi:SAM-dependent methyltransferase
MPTKDQLAAEWSQLAPGWIKRIRGKGDESREGLLDEWMLRAVGDVQNLRVIDLGCGEGRFSRMLAQRGARVTGIDLCVAMIDAAEDLRVSDERYAVGDMENLRDFEDGSFDLAVSYITLVDVHDLGAALRESFRVLRPGGRFIVCNLSPMVTAGNRWLRDDAGNKISFYLDNYFDETARCMNMCDGQVNNVHRTLSTYLNGFVAAGFALEGIQEPYPSQEQLARCPSNADILRVPLFIIYFLRKPDARA